MPNSTNPDALIMAAQKEFYAFKKAGMFEKQAVAERVMQNLLDALQLIAADVRILRDGR